MQLNMVWYWVRISKSRSTPLSKNIQSTPPPPPLLARMSSKALCLRRQILQCLAYYFRVIWYLFRGSLSWLAIFSSFPWFDGNFIHSHNKYFHSDYKRPFKHSQCAITFMPLKRWQLITFINCWWGWFNFCWNFGVCIWILVLGVSTGHLEIWGHLKQGTMLINKPLCKGATKR